MRNCVPVIPALNPPEELIGYIRELKHEGFDKIIVVDDGSREEFKEIFAELREYYGCDLLVHAVNMGKGRALKDALYYYLNEYSQYYKGSDYGGFGRAASGEGCHPYGRRDRD